MAKKIEELIVELGIAGLEKVDRLKSSFRELNKVTKLTDTEITGIRQRLIEFGSEAGNTGKATSGLIKAFEGLIGEARKGSAVWVELNGDLQKFREQSRLTDGQISQLRSQIVSFASGANQSQQSIQGYIASLKQLRSEATIGGTTFTELQQDIQQLTQALSLSEAQATRTNAAIAGLGRAFSGTAAGAKRDIQVLDERIKAQRQIIDDIDVLSAKERRLTGNVQARAAAEAALAVSIKERRQLDFGERIRAGREAVRTGAAAFNDPLATEGFLAPGNVSARFGDLPNTTAALNQELSELSERLINTERNTANYLKVAIRVAGVQREATAATRGLGAALIQELQTGVVTSSQKNLQAAVGQLRSEMAELNPRLKQDAQAYRRLALEVAALERELKQLVNTQGQLGTAQAGGFGAFSAEIGQRFGQADPAIAKAIRRNAEKVEDETERLRKAAQEAFDLLNARTPLMLPAAGQTSAPGTGQAISGGAIPLRGQTGPLERILEPRRQFYGPDVSPGIQFSDEFRRQEISEQDALNKRKAAIEATKQKLMELRGEVSKSAQANDKSINSLNRYRESLVALRNQIPSTGGEFKKLRTQIQQVDDQLERAQRTRRRFNAAQATQAAGAVISGGIFGGPEGAIGGILGTAFGGVPGAFAGAAIGAQVGMVRQAIGSYAEMSAEINRLRQGLAASSNNFTEFTQLVRLTEDSSRRLLIPLADSYRIMAQLRANTVELGYSLEDTKMLFEGTATAVFQTGGNLNDVQGAMRAIVQVLSKGRPQAEEIRSQLGERLPGAIIKFAQETGRSTEELEQAFKNSEVTVDEFFKFAKRNFKDGEGYYESLATSAENAGRRYQKALETTQLNIGRTFESTGAIIQDTSAAVLEWLNSLSAEALKQGLIQSPSYYFEQLITGSLKVEEAEKRLAKLKATANELDLGSPTALFGAILGLDLDPDSELRALEDALKRLRAVQGLAKQREQQQKQEEADRNREQRATSLLQAVEQRENAIAQARIQLEEQARAIRKQAVEQTQQLEERYADQRLQREREIAAARRQLAGIEQDIGFELQAISTAAQGGNPELVRIQQSISQAARQRDEERIALEEKLLDEQTANSRAIEQLKKTTADAINEANARYAKAIGDAQREYARATAKIIEEGTGRAGKRLEIAGQLAGLAIQRAQLNAQRIQVGGGAVPEPLSYGAEEIDYGFDLNLVPKAFQGIDEKIGELYRKLAALPTATSIAAPAISSISVDISDLTGRINQASNALSALNAELKNVSQQTREKQFFKNFLEQAGQQTAAAFSAMRSLQQDVLKSQGVLGLRETGFGRAQAEQRFGIVQTFEEARQGLDTIYTTALELAGEADKEDVVRVFKSIAASLEDAEAKALNFVDVINNVPADIQLRVAIQDIGDELAKLADPVNQIIGAANAIGDAFGNSFKGLITGATSAKEALASFFSSVADYFADMAAKMIAEWIKLAILNTVLRLFPSGSSFTGGYFDPITGKGAAGPNYGFALGGAFAANGIVPYAKGGIVNRPTMFKFARGGTMQTGLMGEAGPEAIMPLKRGPDGKLGVQATGGGGITVNVSVDANGTQVQGDPGQGQQLGRVIAGAVQAELIKQQRPGGLLANSR